MLAHGLGPEIHHLGTLVGDFAAVVHTKPRCEPVSLARGVLEEQRPHQRAQLTGGLRLAHGLLVIAESLGQIDGALVEADVIAGVYAVGALELLREQPREFFGLPPWSV